MPDLVVYGKPKCPQCDAVKRRLTARGVLHTYRDVTEDPSAADVVRLLQYSAVPVVVCGDMHHQGYRPDRLDEYAALATVSDTGHLEAAAVAELTEDGVA